MRCLMPNQVLVATSTLAWGVNTPAHLVIIKGTEYFDAPSRCARPCTRMPLLGSFQRALYWNSELSRGQTAAV